MGDGSRDSYDAVDFDAAYLQRTPSVIQSGNRELQASEARVDFKIVLDFNKDDFHHNVEEKVRDDLSAALELSGGDLELVKLEKGSTHATYEAYVKARRRDTIIQNVKALNVGADPMLGGIELLNAQYISSRSYTDQLREERLGGSSLTAFMKSNAPPVYSVMSCEEIDASTTEETDYWCGELFTEYQRVGKTLHPNYKTVEDYKTGWLDRKPLTVKQQLLKQNVALMTQNMESKAMEKSGKAMNDFVAKIEECKEKVTQTVWEYTNATEESYRFFDTDNEWPCLRMGKTPEDFEPDAIIFEGEFIASEWERSAPDSKGVVTWTRWVQHGDDVEEGLNLMDSVVELDEWEGADPELVALYRRALMAGAETCVELAQANDTVLAQLKQTEGDLVTLDRLNAVGGSLERSNNIVKDMELMHDNWFRGMAHGSRSWSHLDLHELDKTSFKFEKDKKSWSVPPMKGPLSACRKHVDAGAFQFGAMFKKHNNLEFFFQSNDSCLYLIQLQDGYETQEQKLHAIINYADLARVYVDDDDAHFRIYLTKDCLNKQGEMIPKSYHEEKCILLKIDPEDPYIPNHRGVKGLVCQLAFKYNEWRFSVAHDREIQGESMPGPLKVDFHKNAAHFNASPPKRTKKLLRGKREAKVEQGDPTFLALEKQLDTMTAQLETLGVNLDKGIEAIERENVALHQSNVSVKSTAHRVNDVLEVEQGGKNSDIYQDQAATAAAMAAMQ